MAKEKKFQRGYSRLELILLLCIALVVIFLAIPIYNSWYDERQPIAYPDPEQKEVDPWNSGNEKNATERLSQSERRGRAALCRNLPIL